MSDKDIVVETRGLLSRYPEGKVFAPNSRDLDRMPELLRALADEVERLREQWDTRFNVLCGNCGRRYRGPRDENQHGKGVCHAKD